jgi:hypothetical protein
MQRQVVESTTIASFGYDESTATLEIEFRTGMIYQYFDVPQTIAHGLTQAASAGAYFNESIRGAYRYARA